MYCLQLIKFDVYSTRYYVLRDIVQSWKMIIEGHGVSQSRAFVKCKHSLVMFLIDLLLLDLTVTVSSIEWWTLKVVYSGHDVLLILFCIVRRHNIQITLMVAETRLLSAARQTMRRNRNSCHGKRLLHVFFLNLQYCRCWICTQS